MNKLMKMMAAIVALCAGASAQTPELAKVLKEYDEYAKSTEGAAALKSAGEFETQILQFRKDLDAQSETVRAWQKAGMAITAQGTAVSLDGAQRRELLSRQLCFSSDETAKGFGAWFVQAYLEGSGHGHGVPQYIRDMNKETIEKQVAEFKDRVAKSNGQKADFLDPTQTATGQAVIPPEYRREIIRNVEATGVFYVQARRIPLVTIGTTYIPKRMAGVTAYFTAPGAMGRPSSPAFSLVSLTPQKLMALVGVPNEFLASTTLIDLGQFIGWELVYQIADKLDDVFLNGTGSVADGLITGVLQSANISSVAAATTHTTLATVTGTDWGLFPASLTKSYAWERARWQLSLPVFAYVRALKSTIGIPVYQQGGLMGRGPLAADIAGTYGDRPVIMTAPAGQEVGTIEGFPYTIGNKMPLAAASVSKPIALFGDLSKSHAVGMLGDLVIDMSREAYWSADMTAFRAKIFVAMAEQDTDAVIKCVTAAG